jgi:hypothetical protein
MTDPPIPELLTENMLAWRMSVKGQRWQCYHLTSGRIVGFVRRVSGARWEAYICTDKRWPEDDQLAASGTYNMHVAKRIVVRIVTGGEIWISRKLCDT